MRSEVKCVGSHFDPPSTRLTFFFRDPCYNIVRKRGIARPPGSQPLDTSFDVKMDPLGADIAGKRGAPIAEGVE